MKKEEIKEAIKKQWIGFYYSFPIQLLLLHVKKHQFLLMVWLMISFFITGVIGSDFGVNSILLDPEYLDKIGYLSFTLTGIGFGALFVAWNLSCYLLHSHRFEFLISFNSPMFVFFINNAILPLIFLGIYIYEIIAFQRMSQYATWQQITIDVVGFLGGFVLILFATGVYFQFTNYQKRKTVSEKQEKKLLKNDDLDYTSRNRVDNFWSHRFVIRNTRNVDHFLEEGYSTVIFRKHHTNTFIAQLLVFLCIFSLGFFMEKPIFQLPTSSVLFLFFSLVVSIVGALIYWAGGWGTTAIGLILVLINLVSRYDFLGYQSKVYGLDYATKADYSFENFKAIASNQNIAKDIKNMLPIFNKWLKKNTVNKKPKIVFLNVSGGGLRSATFVTAVLQQLDKDLKRPIMDQIFLVSGASGGMFGTTFYREVFLQKKMGHAIPYPDSSLVDIVAQDLLNPMTMSILTNDMFFPIHKFKLDSMVYNKDRGYMLEKKFSENTKGLVDKRLKDYEIYERNATIPLMIFHTNILNDSRRFFVSTQPVSFLMRPVGRYATNKDLGIDAIDFGAIFKEQNAMNAKIASIARINATFPLILPNSVMPTEPATYVMDGGALDNLGSETTFRFLQAFKDWIKENTSGVVIIQIRDAEKNKEIYKYQRQTMLSQMAAPFGTVFSNMEHMQDFTIDQKLGYMNDELNGKIQLISFEYTAEKKEEKAALSFHLTEREKRNIKAAISLPNNQKSFDLVKEVLND